MCVYTSNDVHVLYEFIERMIINRSNTELLSLPEVVKLFPLNSCHSLLGFL